MRIYRLMSVVTIVAFQVACFTTYRIPKTELKNLHGFVAREKPDKKVRRESLRPAAASVKEFVAPDVPLTSINGEAFTFNAKSQVRLVTKDPNASLVFRGYRKVEIIEGEFRGIPIEFPTKSTVVHLEQVDFVEVREVHKLKTAGLIAGIIFISVCFFMAIGVIPKPDPLGDWEGDWGGDGAL